MVLVKYLVFTDLDGTLLVDHQFVTNYTKQTIERWQAKGVMFYIATGRMYELANVVRNRINPAVQLVTSNGAVFDGKNGQETVKLGAEAVELAFAEAKRAHLPMMLFTPSMAYYTERIPRFIARNAANFDDEFSEIGYEEIQDLNRLKEVEDSITNGVIISPREPEDLVRVRKVLASTKLLELSSSSPDNIELIPLNTDKATAIEKIQTELGVDAEHTLVFGDGFNDLGMMKAAKISVAMGNAQPEVKAAANFETETNYNDGVAKFINHYLEANLD